MSGAAAEVWCMGRVELHLRCEVEADKVDAFLAFLREAIPFYESPGGIRVRLLRRDDRSTVQGGRIRFIELVEYADEHAFERDQQRVENDPEMRRYLERWRGLLAASPVVEVYREAPAR